MSNDGPYTSPKAVESAIKAAATAIHQADQTRSVMDLIRQAHYDRLLCRVFSGDPRFVLKGGGGMLARVADTRHTVDIDMCFSGSPVEQTISIVRSLVTTDLGDYFQFEYRSDSPIGIGGSQPYQTGVRVVFGAYLGAKSLGGIKIDVSSGIEPTGRISIQEPANRLHLPRLRSFPYRLYPVVDQIADKICATVEGHQGQPSSREKDLVDLVVLARTQRIEAAQLWAAVRSEFRLRRMPIPHTLQPPASWGARYSQMAKALRPCAGYVTVAQATVLVNRLLEPVFDGSTRAGELWDPALLAWITPGG